MGPSESALKIYEPAPLFVRALSWRRKTHENATRRPLRRRLADAPDFIKMASFFTESYKL